MLPFYYCFNIHSHIYDSRLAIIFCMLFLLLRFSLLSDAPAISDVYLQADVQVVKEALNSTVDVLNAVEGSVQFLLPKVRLFLKRIYV